VLHATQELDALEDVGEAFASSTTETTSGVSAV
jgi:hypothetical protein